MATRQYKPLFKRSNVAGKVPTAGDLLLGEVALNTADVKMYASGTTANEILQIGWDRINRTGDTMTGTLYAPSVSATTISGGTFYGDGSGLTNLPTPSNYRAFRFTAGTSYTFTDFTSVNTLNINKTTGSTTTVILNQVPNTNDFYIVKDGKGDSQFNPITVSGGTYTIDGNSTIQINKKNNPSLTFLFDGTEYIII